MEKRNVGTKGKNPKQVLISFKDLTIELLDGRESPHHRLDKLPNLKPNLWQLRATYPNRKSVTE